jgi:hypothetical protein
MNDVWSQLNNLKHNYCDCALNARIVFRISMAIVIGPTPPGTGVM